MDTNDKICLVRHLNEWLATGKKSRQQMVDQIAPPRWDGPKPFLSYTHPVVEMLLKGDTVEAVCIIGAPYSVDDRDAIDMMVLIKDVQYVIGLYHMFGNQYEAVLQLGKCLHNPENNWEAALALTDHAFVRMWAQNNPPASR